MKSEYKIAVIGVVLALLPLTFASNLYLQRTFTIMLTYVALAIALNIVFGHTDQLFLFTGGLAGTSAYTTVIVANSVGLSPWITLPIGVLLAGVVGYVVSYIAAKRNFTTILIAIFTLGIQLAFIQFVSGSRELAGGTTGMPVSGVTFDPLVYYYGMLAVVVVFLYLYHRLLRSRFGMAFNALREDQLAAETVGVDTVRYKTLTGFIASIMIGFTGVLLAFFEGYVTPSLFTFNSVDVLVLIMVVLGGVRTLEGPVIGGVLVYWIDELLTGTGGLNLTIFGASLILLFLFFQEGIVPRLRGFLGNRFGDSEQPSPQG